MTDQHEREKIKDGISATMVTAGTDITRLTENVRNLTTKLRAGMNEMNERDE
jgi:uncharacterized coiled-coil protein SlyX